MALNALTLSVTSGVQGRRFQAKINGLTTGKVEVLNDGSPGFSTVNGNVMSHGLPYATSTVVLREYEPGVGQGYRDTRIDITAVTAGQIYNQALSMIGAGRTLKSYRVGSERQSDGSVTFKVFAEDDLGATMGLGLGAGGGTPPAPVATAVYGITATADGSTGQTYSLPPGTWTGVQWYRQQLATPYVETIIPGATGTSYVAQAADQGFRLVARGTRNGSAAAFKSYHVVYEPPVVLENFQSLTGWAATNGGLIDLVTDSPDIGSNRLRLTSTGTVNAQATKANIGSFDPSTMGTIAYSADLGMDAARQSTQNHRVVLQRGGVDQYLANVTNTGTNFETPSPLHIGKLWGGYHVSEVAGLATPGVSNMGLYVRQSGQGPYSQETKYGALLGKAGGRATFVPTFDDNKVSVWDFVFPLFQSLDFVGTIYNVGSTSQNPAALNISKILQLYAANWDVGLDSTYNDDITSSFGTLAAAGASLNQNRDLAILNGITRGNEHGAWTGGQIETNPPSARVNVASVTSNGTTVVTMSSTTGITAGMRAVGHNVPNSPKTTVVSVDSATQITLSANVPTQTKPMLFVNDSGEFYTMKLPVYYRDVLGMKTMRTTRAQGGMLTRFGFGDRGMFIYGNALHSLSYSQFTAQIDLSILRGETYWAYTHGVIPGGGGVESDTADFTAKMNYVAQKRDQGLIDVMTPSQVQARDGGASVPA